MLIQRGKSCLDEAHQALEGVDSRNGHQEFQQAKKLLMQYPSGDRDKIPGYWSAFIDINVGFARISRLRATKDTRDQATALWHLEKGQGHIEDALSKIDKVSDADGKKTEVDLESSRLNKAKPYFINRQ
jgi:hypothetical protein